MAPVVGGLFLAMGLEVSGCTMNFGLVTTRLETFVVARSVEELQVTEVHSLCIAAVADRRSVKRSGCGPFQALQEMEGAQFTLEATFDVVAVPPRSWRLQESD